MAVCLTLNSQWSYLNVLLLLLAFTGNILMATDVYGNSVGEQ